MDFKSQEHQTLDTQPRLDRNIMKISDHQLGTKFRSKYDIYTYMTDIRNFISLSQRRFIVHKYLPPKDSINTEFIKQILRNEKEVFDISEVKSIKVPKYDELSAQEDDKVRKYLPDQGQKNKPIDRKYFFDILNTIYPDFVRQLIDHALSIRYQPENNEEKKQYILISDKWYDQLMSHPFISRKPGKTIQLLKESTKMYRGRKIKEKKELGTTLKRFKGMENIRQEQQITKDVLIEIDQNLQGEFSYFTNETPNETKFKKKRFNI